MNRAESIESHLAAIGSVEKRVLFKSWKWATAFINWRKKGFLRLSKGAVSSTSCIIQSSDIISWSHHSLFLQFCFNCYL